MSDVPPDAQPTKNHKRGEIFRLNTGVTVCLVNSRGGDAWESVVVHSLHTRYPVGGYNIVVTDDEIDAEGVRVAMTGGPFAQRREDH